MNPRRIILGGSLAGAVIIAGSMIMNAVVISPHPGAAAIAGSMPLPVVLLRSIALGIFCVLLYALMRPRLGAGAKTAITAGILAFLLGVLFPPFGLTMSGGFPSRLLLMAIIWGAVLLPAAAVAGAWLYREDVTARASTP